MGLLDRPRVRGAARLDARRSCARRSGRSRRSSTSSTRRRSTAIYAPLQEQVKERGLWAAHLPPELGGQGFGQVKLGLMHEILGTLAVRARTRSATRRPTRATREILALAGTPRAEGALAAPAARPATCKSAFSMTEPETPARTRRCCARAPCATATSGSSTATSGSPRNASIADFLIVMAVTDPDARPHQRASMFIVAGRHARRDDRARRADDGAPEPSPSASSAATPRSSTRTCACPRTRCSATRARAS